MNGSHLHAQYVKCFGHVDAQCPAKETWVLKEKGRENGNSACHDDPANSARNETKKELVNVAKPVIVEEADKIITSFQLVGTVDGCSTIVNPPLALRRLGIFQWDVQAMDLLILR